MTTPPPPPVQPQQQDGGLGDPALAVAVAALIVTVPSAALVIAALKARFALSHAVWQAMTPVLGQVMQQPPPVTGIIGPASEQVSRQHLARRAQYVLAATRRVLGAARQARAKGQPVTAAVQDQLARERRFYAQHQQAMWQRATAAGKIDMEAAVHGNLLGWYAVRGDGRTTPECLDADHHNFYADNPPKIGYPGIGPHVGCRCTAGAPWPGGKLLPGSGPRYARAA